MKRADYISWDQYFMGIALLSAERSKDPSTQVGACIVDDNNRILGKRTGSHSAGAAFADRRDPGSHHCRNAHSTCRKNEGNRRRRRR